MNRTTVPAIVEVDWLDAQSTHGWEDRDERLRHEWDGSICKSIGYVVQDDDKGVVLAESLSLNDNVGCTQHIRRGQVVMVRVLRDEEAWTT